MTSLLDDDGPPPVIGLAGVLALLAAIATSVYEAVVIFTFFPVHPLFWLFSFFAVLFQLMLPQIGTTLLCLAAVHFRQQRWAFIAAMAMLPGLVVPIVWLVIADLMQ